VPCIGNQRLRVQAAGVIDRKDRADRPMHAAYALALTCETPMHEGSSVAGI
jgi:hypothetical protein